MTGCLGDNTGGDAGFCSSNDTSGTGVDMGVSTPNICCEGVAWSAVTSLSTINEGDNGHRTIYGLKVL